MAEKGIIETLESEIKKIEDNASKFLFFVVDTKGMPAGVLSYEYDLALQLKKLGYKVEMIHNEKEFVGVKDWLGEEYSELPHLNIEKDSVMVSPSDVLFIPEMCAGVMAQTRTLSCKRVALLHSLSYLVDSVTMGASWSDLRINECIAATENLAKKAQEFFPGVKTHVIRPSVQDFFFDEAEKPQQLIINLVLKDNSTLNQVLKPFYWKYPLYAWVAFRPINKNLSRKDFAKALRESFATIWVDDSTDIGYSALEAMASGNLVIGKIPENAPDWLVDENGTPNNAGLWFYGSYDSQDLIATAIQSFITNAIPEDVYKQARATAEKYTTEQQVIDIKEHIVKGILEERKNELRIAIGVQRQNEENNKKENAE